MLVGHAILSDRRSISVAVVVGGQALPVFRRPWGGRVYVAGEPGMSFTLEVTNCTLRTIELVTAVDRTDLLSDRPASIEHRGIEIGVQSRVPLVGWRRNGQAAGDFVFRPVESVAPAHAANATARAGVIGFAVFNVTQESHSFPYVQGPLEPAPGDVLNGSAAWAGGDDEDTPDATSQLTRRRETPDRLVIGYASHDWLAKEGFFGAAEPDPFCDPSDGNIWPLG